MHISVEHSHNNSLRSFDEGNNNLLLNNSALNNNNNLSNNNINKNKANSNHQKYLEENVLKKML